MMPISGEIWGALAGAAVAWGMGGCLLWLALTLGRPIPKRGWDSESISLVMVFSLLLGLGAAGLLDGLLLILGNSLSLPTHTIMMIAPLLLLVGGGAGCWLIYKRTFNRQSKHQWLRPTPKRPMHWRMVQTICIILMSVAIYMAMAAVNDYARRLPHGSYDAWNNWNLKARFIYRDASSWDRMLSGMEGHTDYPLLLPVTIAHFWRWAGHETLWVQHGIHQGVCLLSALVMFTGLAKLRGWKIAAMGTMAMLASPGWLRQSSLQYADETVGLFMLGAMVLLAVGGVQSNRERWRWWGLASFTAGLAACVKNEGILFWFVCGVILVSGAVIRGRAKEIFKRALLWFVGGAIPLFWIWIFKHHAASSNDLVESWTMTNVWNHLMDGSRYSMILFSVRRMVPPLFDPWVIFAVISLVVCAGFPERGRQRRTCFMVTGALTLMIFGYFMVYLLTPAPLRWHLTTSLTRVAIGLWPSVVFTAFLAIKKPRNPWPISAGDCGGTAQAERPLSAEIAG